MDRAGLLEFIQACPIIDNHCHPLLPLSQQSENGLLTITSEATGLALAAAKDTLPYIRAVRQLCEEHGIQYSDTEDSWQKYLEKRKDFKEDDFTRNAFKGIDMLLLDDGLSSKDKAHPYDWHSKFTKHPAKRIVRIERVAEEILVNLAESKETDPKRLVGLFRYELENTINALIVDKNVVGFKSVVCYRSGLDIGPGLDLDSCTAYIEECVEGSGYTTAGKTKINNKPLNDYIVNMLAMHIDVWNKGKEKTPKPIQFHTGLGDNDLTLSLSNPAHLQSFIKAYPDVPIVLLHAAYPFTQEAGYLASVYSNVYLDIGEIFPMVSRSGQENALKQALEITPSTKLCWSTDGHFFQETYSLAVKQIKETFSAVLPELVAKKDLTYEQASKIVKDLFFETSNTLYNLKLLFELPPAATLATGSPVHDTLNNLQLVQRFFAEHPDIRYVRLNWVDYTSTVRTRIVPKNYPLKRLSEGHAGIVSVLAHSLYTLQDDSPAIPDFTATGELDVVPSWDKIYIHPRTSGKDACHTYADVMCGLSNKTGERSAYPGCPRNVLAAAIVKAEKAGLRDIKIGFEMEFCLFEQEALEKGFIVPISTAHAWSTSRALQAGDGKALDILEEMLEALAKNNIEVIQFHSESAPGQYEIALGPLPPMQAVDQLVHAREMVTYIAATHGYRATFHPKPIQTQAGTGAHMHFSFKPSHMQDSFVGGVLSELRSICAFTLAAEDSYNRVVDGLCSGGTWCTWGEQNREAALRRIDKDDAHWELKVVDGFANPYLALAAVLTAGILGVQGAYRLPPPCNLSAASLTAQERRELHILDTLPRSLGESLNSFFHPEDGSASSFIIGLGTDVGKRYMQVKEAEMQYMQKIGEGSKGDGSDLLRTIWLVERY